MKAYKALVGLNNVLCPGKDKIPVLKNQDPNFIALMESCPCETFFYNMIYWKSELTTFIFRWGIAVNLEMEVKFDYWKWYKHNKLLI